MPLRDVDIVRLNARIAKQREELAHKEFVIRNLRAEIERQHLALSDDDCAICGKSRKQHSTSSGYGVCQIYPVFVSKRQMVDRLLDEAKGDIPTLQP